MVELMSKKNFYKSKAWLELRYQILREQEHVCALCGQERSANLSLHVDHIKPRSKHPELELDKHNLQILCEDCNLGKSNKYHDDWRDNQDRNSLPPWDDDAYSDGTYDFVFTEIEKRLLIAYELLNPQNNVVQYPPNGIYEGNLKNGMRHGYGTYTWPDGCVYEGDWYEGRRQGYGRMLYSSHDISVLDEHHFINTWDEFDTKPRRYQWLPTHEWIGEGIYKGDWNFGLRHGLGEWWEKTCGEYLPVDLPARFTPEEIENEENVWLESQCGTYFGEIAASVAFGYERSPPIPDDEFPF